MHPFRDHLLSDVLSVTLGGTPTNIVLWQQDVSVTFTASHLSSRFAFPPHSSLRLPIDQRP
jgi:hypothetical protein